MNVFFLAIIVIFIYGTISDFWLRKKFNIAKAKWGFYKSVNRLHRWVDISLFLLFLIGSWIMENNYLFFLFLIFALFCSRAFMEWKYERAKKEYILTINSIFSSLIFLGLVYLFI
jgi:hypothetical protein